MADAQFDTASASQLVAITPSNSTPAVFRGIYVGGAGDVTVTAQNDTVPVTFKACPVGFVVPAVTKLVMATGTTATFLVGLV